jgi:hypothetical protein
MLHATAPVCDLIKHADGLLLLGRQRGHLPRVQLGGELVVAVGILDAQVPLG